MMSLTGAGRRAARLVESKLDIDDLHAELEALRDTVHELSARAGRSASRGYGRARAFASETVDDAEEVMKDHLAASLLLAIGLGIAVGYLLRRRTE